MFGYVLKVQKRIVHLLEFFDYMDVYRLEYQPIIILKYFAYENRVAIVRGHCNTSVPEDTIVFNPSGFIDGFYLHLSAHSTSFCPNGPTPSPFPTFIPSIPTPLPNPTENPFIQSVVYHSNSTHYILFDLKHGTGKFHDHHTNLLNVKSKIPFYFNFSYWNLSQPPQDYLNPYNIDLANIWGCYQVNGAYSCYSIGDRRINVYGNDYDNGDLENGITITYRGLNAVDSQIDIYCSEEAPPGLIDFSNKEVVYHLGTSGTKFRFEGLAEFACPKHYQSRIPSPVSSTPTPLPCTLR